MNSQPTPQRALILALSDSSMMTLSSVLDPLRAANRLSKAPLFDWQIRSPNGAKVALTCGIDIDVAGSIAGDERGDILFVVAGFNHAKHVPPTLLPKIRRMASGFKTICSIEAGAWVLARAGVITNHTITTHWEDLENLAFAYPQLNVVNQRFVIDRNVWSTGGASPSLDMLLHYLRLHERQSLALDVANVFIHNESPGHSDFQFGSHINWLDGVEPRLARAIRLMEDNTEHPISINALAQKIGLSVRLLEVMSKKHLGLTPGAHYLRLRLQAARRLVLDTDLSMLDISVRTGFNDPSTFSRAFKRRYQTNPLTVRAAARELPHANSLY